MKDVTETNGEMWLCHITSWFNVNFLASENGTRVPQEDSLLLRENAEGRRIQDEANLQTAFQNSRETSVDV